MKHSAFVSLLLLLHLQSALYASYSPAALAIGAASVVASASYTAQAVDEICNGSAGMGERAIGALLGGALGASVVMQEHTLPVCLLLFAANGVVDAAERCIVQKTSVLHYQAWYRANYAQRKKVHTAARTIGAVVALQCYMHQDTTPVGLAGIACPAALVAVLLGAAVGRVGVTPVLADIFAQKDAC